MSNPSDAARRVAIADGLLTIGFRPSDIFKALEFDPTELHRLEKFNPDEPRNPKGSGRVSGEWTREIEEFESAVEAAAKELPQIVQTTSRVLPAVAGAASRLAGPAAFLTALLIPTPAGGANHQGPVPGYPGLRYFWNGDSPQLWIIRESDGRTVLQATIGENGKLSTGTNVVGRLQGDKVAIDPLALPPEWPNVDVRNDDRRLCPKDTPDRGGRTGPQGEKDRDYEDYMKRFVNPEMPTPRGFAYLYANPVTGQSAMIDDCKRTNGDPYEAKSTGYAAMLAKDVDPMTKNLRDEWIDQAIRQLNSAPGHKLHWCFAEKETPDYVEELFKESKRDRRLAGIDICRLYWTEGMQ